MLAFGLALHGQALAQDDENQSQESIEATASVETGDFAQRLELAKEMHKIRSTRDQVDSAVESVSQRLPEDRRMAFKSSMQNALNYNAIEKISINAMAETFTKEELEAMVEYNKKPEAQSANVKFSEYQNLVGPEIIKMIDKAMMRMRTGAPQ